MPLKISTSGANPSEFSWQIDRMGDKAATEVTTIKNADNNEAVKKRSYDRFACHVCLSEIASETITSPSSLLIH